MFYPPSLLLQKWRNRPSFWLRHFVIPAYEPESIENMFYPPSLFLHKWRDRSSYRRDPQGSGKVEPRREQRPKAGIQTLSLSFFLLLRVVVTPRWQNKQALLSHNHLDAHAGCETRLRWLCVILW